MAKYLDAIELSNNLKNRLEEIVLSSISVRDEELQNELSEIIKSNDGLISEILVEGAFSAKKHDDILRNIPFLNKKFLDLLDLNKVFNPNFYPFKHQFETLKIVNEMDSNNKPAIVVTAPTGSGKTESFLLPMLNDLVSNPRKSDEKGVRAIILYPMNALVADQNKRLFSYLKGQSNVSMFFYNSETPESKKYATDEFDDKCFIKTRKEARDNPPDIMITNYSMLEYILARPNDFPLIDNALRTIVVDEAHLYTGTLAAEVSLLLRRVNTKAKVDNSKILYIATTATISDDKQEQQDFFSKFFNKDNIHRVSGEKEFKEIDATINVDNEIEQFIDISFIISKPNLDLYNEFKGYRVFPKILKILSEKYTIQFSELLKLVSSSIEPKTLLNIFTIGAKARLNDNELPLLPHKLHLQVRSSQGFSVCSNPNCPDSKIKGLGKIHHGTFYNCTTCQSPTLNLIRCSECSEHFYHGKFNDKDTLYLERFFKDDTKSENSHILSFKESSEAIYISKDGKKCSEHDYNNKFYKHSVCPVCSNEEFYGLSVSDQFLIPLVSETMLVNMPEIDKEVNVFLPARGRRLLTFSDSRSEAARLGPLLTMQHETQLFRRLIVETIQNNISKNQDNELREYYQNEIKENELKLSSIDNPIVKQKLVEKINDAKVELSKMSSGLSITDLVDNIKKHPLIGEFFDRERMKEQSAEEREQLSYNKNLDSIKGNVYELLTEAIAIPNEKQVNLESIGLLKFNFQLDDFDLIRFTNFMIEKTQLFKILKSIIYLSRQQRAFTIETNYYEVKDYQSNLTGVGKYVAYDAKNKNIFNLKLTSRSSIYKFISSVLRGFEIEDTEENVHTFLEAVFETFLDAAKRDDIRWLEHNRVQTDDGRIVDAFRIVFYELSIEIPQTLYLNTINKTIWQEAINGVVPVKHNIVELKEVTQSDLDADPYFSRYRKMYLNPSKELSMGLWAEEHSAQLAQKENRRLQDLFIQGKRNVLSATTTLEVGIDIGGLSGVLMANVPPNKANYIQRSGRAGRRTDGSSIILTYTKTRHFDQNVFRDFKFYLDKPHKKLTISLEKEKIATRHFNSLMLFKFYENHASSKDALIFDSFKKMGYFVGIYEIPKHTDNPYAKLDFEMDESSIYNKFIEFLTNFEIIEDDKKAFDEIFKHTSKVLDYQQLIKIFSDQVQAMGTIYINSLKELYGDWNFATNSSHKNAVRYNIKQKHGESLIEIFSNAQVLPKYGFPIDIKTLQVINAPKMFELSRGSFLALSEYAPGSKILAGGMLIESKGISKHFTGENLDEAFGEKGFTYLCDKGHFFTSPYIKVHECSMSGCKGVVKPASNYLMPEHGYITAASDKLSYRAGSPEKVGRLEIHSAIHTSSENDINFSYDDFSIIYKEKALIYGVNRGNKGLGFAICTKCGYTESEIEKVNTGSYDKLPTSFKKHSSIYSESSANICLETSPTIWRNHNLIAKMITDAIMIIPKRDIKDINIAQTLANAMQLSGAEELGIDEREINALIQEVDGKLSILIYDNQSGGVGYVYDLAKNRWNDWLEKTRQRLFIDEKHNEECLNGCIKCVVTMNTSEPLPRRETLDYLESKTIPKNEDIKIVKKKNIKKEISKEDRMKRFKK
ncbi:DEAD/DEAH box helicase [Arcobacter vandammei]|uniref:DEAD/DEAH box helicase n=1 Tax=Arcobacter vandammei TaxID=2782243 RepID=UPI0018E00E33|nr:DEAD/DEAH box helicase [Arcobacter vandammei]